MGRVACLAAAFVGFQSIRDFRVMLCSLLVTAGVGITTATTITVVAVVVAAGSNNLYEYTKCINVLDNVRATSPTSYRSLCAMMMLGRSAMAFEIFIFVVVVFEWLGRNG